MSDTLAIIILDMIMFLYCIVNERAGQEDVVRVADDMKKLFSDE